MRKTNQSLRMQSSIEDHERFRLEILNKYENSVRQKGFLRVAGIDEAGRGPLAGPVVAAACIIPEGLLIPGVDDSKKLTPQVRFALFEQIKQEPQIVYGVGIVSPADIDRVNIYQATILAMLQAVEALREAPDFLLVDGMELKHPTIPCQKIIKGDTLSQSIGAASIIAKETRDKLMVEYDQKWPQYGFARHKGYGTQEHFDAINKYGACPIHRMTFEPLKTVQNRELLPSF